MEVVLSGCLNRKGMRFFYTSAQKSDEFYRGKCDLELNNGAETAEAFQREAKLFFARLVESLREEKRHGNK